MVHLEIEKFGSRDRSIQEELSPRDLLFLKKLTRYGLTIIEIKVSPISPVVGKKIYDLVIPDNSILVNVIKKNQSHFPSKDLVLENGDIVYFLASQVVEDSLKEVFIPPEFK
ncbi:MAG: TrkA C-terminal domain-containing protein [Cyanobacteriota bacterium]